LRTLVAAIKDLGEKSRDKLEEWSSFDPSFLRILTGSSFSFRPYDLFLMKENIERASSKDKRRELIEAAYMFPNNFYCPGLLKRSLRKRYEIIDSPVPFEISSKKRQRKIETYAPGGLRLIEA
jgi:hypothetical protein